jgi:hypothetical protein
MGWGIPLTEIERRQFEAKLADLRIEHRDLDAAILRLGLDPLHDQLALKRMKKRKLLLKDQIAWLERQLDPDIPA